ncbi:hypothetical protein ACHAPE_008079 [Trichoderma viride]
MAIHGLYVPPTIEDMKQSSLAYNLLPDDGDQPDVQQVHLQELASLLERFHVQNKFGIHLIHGHLQLDVDSVMFGTNLKSIRGCWTKPTSIDKIKPAEVHGHIFRLMASGNMQAYEYREGPIASLDNVNPVFFEELVKYLQANDLTDLLGLEVLTEEVPEMMCEFVLENNGTVMLDSRDLKSWTPFRTTGFVYKPGMVDLQGSQSHAKTVRHTHQVLIGGKIGKEDPLMDVLRDEDIVY